MSVVIVPELVVAHISDPHFLPPSHPDAARTRNRFRQCLETIQGRRQPPAAIIVTGDLTQYGDADAYEELRAIARPAAEELGAQMLWVAGNHDNRSALSRVLLEQEQSDPIFQVLWIDGLRIIGLDSLVNGSHYGQFSATHLAALSDELESPAPKGTILAFHHPPLPPVLDFMQRFTLRGQDELAEVVRGSDVRAILTGHLHHGYFATFEQIPVATAPSIGRPLDLSRPTADVVDRDGPWMYHHVAVYPETITHATVVFGDYPHLPNLRADV